jgi:hypothetical protein
VKTVKLLAIALAFLVCSVTVATAASETIQVMSQQAPTASAAVRFTDIALGNYVTEGGWSRLLIDSSNDANHAVTHFSIRSDNPVGGCEIEGELTGNAGVSSTSGGEVCSIQFSLTKNGVNVKAKTLEVCKKFCGSNADFEGEYLKISKACVFSEVEKSRRKFKYLYDVKDYQKALSILQPVLSVCANVLDEFELGQIRNDVAITQYKMGLHKDCLVTLAPYMGDAKRKNSDITMDWADATPSTAGSAKKYLQIIKAARSNIRLCSR